MKKLIEVLIQDKYAYCDCEREIILTDAPKEIIEKLGEKANIDMKKLKEELGREPIWDDVIYYDTEAFVQNLTELGYQVYKVQDWTTIRLD